MDVKNAAKYGAIAIWSCLPSLVLASMPDQAPHPLAPMQSVWVLWSAAVWMGFAFFAAKSALGLFRLFGGESSRSKGRLWWVNALAMMAMLAIALRLDGVL